MIGIRKLTATLAAVVAIGTLAPACSKKDDDALVIYSGRSKALVQPLVDRYQEEAGVKVKVRYGDTAQLAIALMEEADESPADLFWGQDAGALGALDAEGLLAPLPDELTDAVPEALRGESGTWVATSGRARVLAYSPERVDEAELPTSVFDLTEEPWKGRVGWAPPNGSFQSFVTAMISTHGEDTTRTWLEELKANGAEAYPKNSALIEAIASGAIDAALVNHYYLLRFRDEDPDYPVAQTTFEDGDVGNLVNVAGLGMLSSSSRKDEAKAFLEAMLEPEAQRYFADETFEYPVVEIDGVSQKPGLLSHGALMKASPRIDLDALADLERSLDLLREVGLL